ncbi:TIGR03915 family putative DNA repair protein [Aminivibrio sp.]|jgi:probable DNA metabolism protein|uniref:TIGR03915 family putative DNA repair protein n=1 Tax=Aminivibrio sp. TaxID=1872489 RepID=UPI001A4742B9|nr:TIGR03915 family putative DNA repair protein [Aminivibrio sp.]MBL3539895.1 TIGR03915 family putative DNA repair protein [Aminivibrio sp.]
MAVWTFDGTFNGFLCLIHESARKKERPEGILGQGKKQPLLFETVQTATDENLAASVRTALAARFSRRVLAAGYYAFLSAMAGREMAVYRYFALAWTVGPRTAGLLADERVRTVHEAGRTVSRERHRFLGLLRFTELRGVLYAPFEPEGDILPLVAGHFARRLGGERWIIHDTGRNKAAVFENGTWRMTAFRTEGPLPLSGREQEIRDLWKGYFSSTAVQTRKNAELQRRFMPKKYWKYLPEKEDGGGVL